MKELPATVAGLLEALDRLYPHRCVGPDESLRDADRRAGARELVDFLLNLQEKGSTAKDGLPSVRLR